MTQKTYKVPDVSCGHCKKAIESAVGAMAGVESVDVNVESRTVDIAFDEAAVTESAILATLVEEGYPAAA